MPKKLETQIIEEAESELIEGLKNAKFFQENLGKIKKDFLRKYVVIKNQQIIDSGADVMRLQDLYSKQLVLIATYFDALNDYLESPLADSPNEYN